MPATKNVFSSIFIVLMLANCSGEESEMVATPSGWISYVGSHYETRSWAGSVRDPGGARQVGYDAADPAASLTTFNTTLTNNIAPLLPGYYQVLSVGGLGSGRDPAEVSTFMEAIKLDSAAGFRGGLYQRAKAVAALNGAVEKVYWQFGNEINSQTFSENLHLWAADGATSTDNDTSTISWLVEYFIAPGAEGVRQASQELFADPRRIRIMLGSVVAADNATAQTFLNALLDYQITGTYAPNLAGKYVRDIVDTISIHYTVGTPDTGWRAFLDGLYTNRIVQGNIRSVFSTEEVGVQAADLGYGMSTAVRALTRYLDWWLGHNMTPDQGHVFFWGNGLGPSGTTIDELMPTLYGFLGDVALLRPTGISTVAGAANLEYYEYESASQHRRILSIFSADGLSATTLNSITVNAGWNNLAVTGHLYTSTGDQAVTPVVTRQSDGTYLLAFVGTLTINPRESLLLLLQE